jgi:pyruvate dehydrogenase E2 component (dihydrolipoamide acetyltransferase)
LITYPLWKLVKESFISKKIIMAVAVIMPRQGQSVETCIITEWLKKKDDPVKTGDILFSYETDKASFDGEAPADGVLLDIFAAAGDEVPVLTNIAVIGNPGEDVNVYRPGGPVNKPAAGTAPSEETVHAPVVVSEIPVPDASDRRIRISPRAKAMAVKMGLNPSLLKGTGPNGRIIVRDLENVQGQSQGSPEISSGSASPSGTSSATAFSQFQGAAPIGAFEEKKLSNVRKLIAKAMFESISTSAQLTHHMSADVRKLLALRNQVKAELDKGSNVNITLNDMICFAVIRALEKFPEINTHFTGNSLRTFKKVHLGLAVDTPRGLMVPAVQHADDLSLKGLSARLREVADQCRKGNVNPELLASTAASFTVSNLGNYGVEMFTPIINLPQVAILGVNTIISRPADLGNGTFGFIPVIGLSLTYDHRAVDGGPATLFLKEIKYQIENFNEKI